LAHYTGHIRADYEVWPTIQGTLELIM